MEDPAPIAAWQTSGDPRRAITLDHLLLMQNGLDLGDSLTASVRVDSVQLTGPVTAQWSGRGITIAFPIMYPAKHHCTATLRATLELWNGERLLEGGGAVDGPCADGGHQDAAFVFRRSP